MPVHCPERPVRHVRRQGYITICVRDCKHATDDSRGLSDMGGLFLLHDTGRLSLLWVSYGMEPRRNVFGILSRRDDSARNAIEPPAMIPDFALFLSQNTFVAGGVLVPIIYCYRK